MLRNKRIRNLHIQLKKIEDREGYTCDKDGRAIINVGAENYDDIFSPYCYKGGDTLSSTLVEYLNQKANTVPLDHDLTIRFHVKDASEEKRKEIRAALKENYQSDIRGIDNKMQSTALFSMWFILLGILFTVAYLLLLDKVPIAVTYIMDLFSWLFLWEGIDAFFLDRRLMKRDKLKALRLATAKLEIIEFEPY